MCKEIENCRYYGGYIDQKIFIGDGSYPSPRDLVEDIQKISLLDLERY